MTDHPSGETEAGMAGLTSAGSFKDAASIPACPPFDTSKYRGNFAAFELTGEQEWELLETLWSIMSSFVELGFRFDVCAAVFGPDEFVAAGEADAVDSSHARVLENADTTGGESS